MINLLQVSINLRDAADAGEIANVTDFNTFLGSGIQMIIIIASLLTFGYMVWGAVDWILAGGDSGKIESARKKLTQGVIGLLLLASTAAVFILIQYFLGVEILDGGDANSLQPPTGGNPNCPPGQTCPTL